MFPFLFFHLLSILCQVFCLDRLNIDRCTTLIVHYVSILFHQSLFLVFTFLLSCILNFFIWYSILHTYTCFSVYSVYSFLIRFFNPIFWLFFVLKILVIQWLYSLYIHRWISVNSSFSLYNEEIHSFCFSSYYTIKKACFQFFPIRSFLLIMEETHF